MNAKLLYPEGVGQHSPGSRERTLGTPVAHVRSTLKGLHKARGNAAILSNPFRVETTRVSRQPRVAEAATLGCDVKPLRGNNVRSQDSSGKFGTTKFPIALQMGPAGAVVCGSLSRGPVQTVAAPKSFAGSAFHISRGWTSDALLPHVHKPRLRVAAMP